MTTQNVEVLPDDPTLEMPVSNEVLSGIAELPPLTPGEQQLLEAITFHEVVQHVWHERFNDTVKKVVESCIDPQDQACISMVASAVEWEWFGEPNDPLPEGVQLNDHGDLQFESDFIQEHQNAIRIFLQQELAEINVDRFNYYHDYMQDAIEDALAAVVKETPAYAFLHALATEVPQPEDVPLTLAQRMIREAQAEEHIRNTYLLQEERRDSLREHHGAHRALQRQITKIEDETMRRPRASDSDPKDRLLNYIITELNRHEELEGDRRVVAFIGTNDYGSIIGCTQSGGEVHLGEEMFETSEDWISAPERNGSRLLTDYDTSWNLLTQLATGLINPANKHKSAVEILSEAAQPCDDEVIHYNYASIKTGIKVYLGQHDLPVYRERFLYGRSLQWEPRAPEVDAVSVYSKDGYESASQAILGTVAGGGLRESSGRVVTGVRSVRRDLPEHINDYNLMLFVDDVQAWSLYGRVLNNLRLDRIEDVEPYIPGYQVAGHDAAEGVWYFKQAEEDPYKGSAEVRIEDDHKNALVQQLRVIGMTAFASEVEALDNINLAQLVGLLSKHSDYTFDSRYDLPSPKGIFTDEDFAKIVDEKGRLQVQCTGSAAFLRHVLKTALPESTTVKIAGMTIRAKGDIPYVGHAQVLVAYGGNQYIVDATPPSTWGGMVMDSAADAASGSGRHNARADRSNPFAEKVSDIFAEEPKLPEIVTTNTDRIIEEHAQQAASVVDRTKLLLKAHFNLATDCPDEKLYEQVVKLKKDADPLRRVLELTLQYERSTLDMVELLRTRDYLEKMTERAGDATLLKRLGIPKYDQQFINALSGVVADLETAHSGSLQK